MWVPPAGGVDKGFPCPKVVYIGWGWVTNGSWVSGAYGGTKVVTSAAEAGATAGAATGAAATACGSSMFAAVSSAGPTAD